MKEGVRKRFHVISGEGVLFFFPNSVGEYAHASLFDINFLMHMFLSSAEWHHKRDIKMQIRCF